MRRRAALVLALWLVGVGLAAAPPKPGPKELCPVCGMLVAKYPNWVATVEWKDGHVHHFDGAKDLFKFLQSLAKYAPQHKSQDIGGLFVTEFYGLEKIDARKAYYVIGSDVMGPMGHELTPLATKDDAEDFLRDHKGKRILRFEEVTPEVIARVDAGRF